MKSYACYPKTRAGYRTPGFGFVNPYFSQTAVENAKRSSTANRPAANILRTEGAYVIQLAIPGLTKEQVNIELNEGQLIITGQEAAADPNLKFTRREFDFSGFQRTFRLHKNANTAALTATFDNGILTVTIPDLQPETFRINIQ